MTIVSERMGKVVDMQQAIRVPMLYEALGESENAVKVCMHV